MSFYNTIRNSTPEVLSRLKFYSNNTSKLAKAISRKEFLIDCRRHKVFPPHIENQTRSLLDLFSNITYYMKDLQNAIVDFKRRLLNIEIKDVFRNLKDLSGERNNLSIEIRSIDDETMGRFLATQDKSLNYKINSFRKVCEKKFYESYNKTVNQEQGEETGQTLDQNLFNLSGKQLPIEVQKMLSLGSKFALPLKMNEIPYTHVIAGSELVTRTIENTEMQNEVRPKIANIITNHIHKFGNLKSDAHTVHLNNLYEETKSYLKECRQNGNELVVINSDKGNKTVVMEKTLYQSTVEKIVEDGDMFERLTYDPTEEVQRGVNKLIDELHANNFISQPEKFSLKINNSIPPRMYCLPKIHKLKNTSDLTKVKEELKGRPVVSSIGSATYKLSKFISNILTKSFTSKYSVKNSREFVAILKNTNIPNDYVMISLDVISLFPSMLLSLVLNAIKKRWSQIEKFTNISKDLFLKIIKFIITSSYCKVNGKFYKQRVGAAMGDPLSPILVELGMEDLTDCSIMELGFDVALCIKYVDDFFMMVPREEVENVLTVFNRYNSNIQFTMEVEDNNQIPYLDVMVIRLQSGELVTKWYKKPFASSRLLNFRSNHKFSQKSNVAFQFIKRVCDLTTCNSPDENWELILKILRSNNYPVGIIRKLFDRYRNQLSLDNDIQRNGENKETRVYRPLISVDGLTENIQKCIRKVDKRIIICPKNLKTVRSLYTPVKDKIDKEKQSNVIYKIPCSSCDKSYIGMTHRQYLSTRIGQHVDDVENIRKSNSLIQKKPEENYKTAIQRKIEEEEAKTSKNAVTTKKLNTFLKNCEKSGVVSHFSNLGHCMNFKKVSIVDRADKKSTLEIIEGLNIKIHNNINKKEENSVLGNYFDGILNKLKKFRT